MMDDMLSEVEPMIPALRRYARGLLSDTTAADDLVQDCLERVVAHWGRRRNEDARTWVFTILHNLAVNVLRQKARRGYPMPIDDMREDIGAVQATQEGTVFEKQILAAVDRLPPDHRCIILLISVEDLSYAEAAKVLGIPVGTVMSRLSRARQQLQILLDDPHAKTTAERPHLRRVK